MDKYSMERRLFGMCISREYHTDYPEENNIVSGYQHVCRIEVIQFFCLIRPSQCRERPQCRTKPGIQRILILCEMCTSTLRTLAWHLSCHYNLAALVTVVRRNPVSPPDLSGNTPVADILQPVQINLIKTLRNKFQFSRLNRIDCRFCQLLHLHKPLLFYHWLYRGMAPVMGSYIMRVWLDLYQVSLFFQIFHHCLSCFVAIHTCIFAAPLLIDGGVVVHHINFRKVVTLSNLKVVRVVSRSNLYSSGSKLFIYIVICHNRNLSVRQWQEALLPYDVFVSLIIRMHCNRCIS